MGAAMHVLVTGGAGYIGSYVARALVTSGHLVTVVDDLSNGHADAVEPPAQLVVDDVANADVSADVIVHLASRIDVAGSARAHWTNNVGIALSLLERTSAKRIVFASSAAVYGLAPAWTSISERADTAPISAYGQTKVAIEQMLSAFDIEWSVLRLFNVAGGRERHKKETHLLPLALGGEVTVHGSSEMMRDYVHVEDVADAFIRAIDGRCGIYNIGTGVGTTVRELIDCVERVTGHPVRTTLGPPRSGDPLSLVADTTRARNLLGWAPTRGLEEIVRSAQ